MRRRTRGSGEEDRGGFDIAAAGGFMQLGWGCLPAGHIIGTYDDHELRPELLTEPHRDGAGLPEPGGRSREPLPG